MPEIRKTPRNSVSWGPRSGRADPFKTCTKCRWVASMSLRCFQLPAVPRRGAGRPAVHAMRWASRFRDVGLNKTRHAPSRKKLCVRAVLLREEGLHKLLIHQLQLLLTVQGGELFLAVCSITLRITRPYSSSRSTSSTEPSSFPSTAGKKAM